MIAHNGALIWKSQDPSRFDGRLRYARTTMHGQEVYVAKHTWANVTALRAAGFKAPSPPMEEWKYTGRFNPMAHQRTGVEFCIKNPRLYNLSDMGCVDSDTEYLSPTGWKRIADYTDGEVAQYWPRSGRIEFVEPKQFVKLPCHEMIRFKTTRGVDQLLSPEHRVLYSDWSGTPSVDSAENIERRMQEMPMGWKGRFYSTFKPDCKRPGIDLSDAQLRVQIAVIADGYFGGNTNRCVIRVKKTRKIERLRKLLLEANIEYIESQPQYESALGFSVFKFYAPIRVKEFDARFWDANEDQIKLITDEVVNWDGSERKAGSDGFYSNSKASVDFIQYCYAASGRTASLGYSDRDGVREYRVHARQKSALLCLAGCSSTGEKISNIWREPSTDGFKYCFMVPSTFLLLRRNGNIFLTGNTGKTGTSLWAAEYLLQRDIVRRILISCPLSVIGVWNDELFNIAPHRTAAILFGSKQKRIDLLGEGTQYCIINHDGITTIPEQIASAKFDLIIVDEASTYRNANTQRYKTFKKISEQTKMLWLLTGTPAPTAPTDVYGLIKLIEGKDFKMSFTAFKELTMRKVSNFVWVPRPDSNETIYKLMKPAIRFRKEDCIDLPPLTYVNRACLLSNEQHKAFESMRKQMAMTREGGTDITAANAAVLLQKLMQICCGVVRDNDSEVHCIDSAPRLELLKEIIEESGNKAIVFIPFKGVMENVKQFLIKSGIGCEIVNGDTSQGMREQIFSSFQRGSLPVLLAHPKTTAHGLTLTAASCIVWFGPIFSAELYSQGNARIHRTGQKNKCTVVHIGGHALEWKLYDALNNKLKLQDRILELYEEYFK